MNSYEVRETLISVDSVSLSFDDKPILRDVCAEVHDLVRPGCTQGQIVGVLGPSGIGKTQLSRIMAGLQAPTSGSVNVHDSGKVIPVRPGLVGVVAQNYPLLRHRTVLGNLVVAARQHGMSPPGAREKSLELLAKFGLTDRSSYYPSQLSGGQRQRVAIAQQLLCSDHFIIMDEPFTGLDPIMKDLTCQLISEVAAMDERNTIFVVAHDIAAVSSISDTLWLLGRDRDVQGQPIPGSRIQAKYDLAAMGLAWRPDVASDPAFHALLADVKSRFKTL